MSHASAYRRGFELMRRAAGPDCHLQDCGPAPVTVGLSDSMRIELDQNYGYRRQAWTQYFGNPRSSAAAAAKRYYFHKRAWVNDADHVCLAPLEPEQARAAATLIALTGGNTLSGDRLTDLDPVRLDILSKILPSGGEAAEPVGLFDADPPAVFALRLRRPFAEWTVVGLFNPDPEAAAERAVPLERLRLDPSVSYLAWDFWRERLHPVANREVRAPVPAGGVTLLALRERLNRPRILSTDRHVLQGAVELEDERWDPEAGVLEAVSLGPPGTAHHATVYLPEPRPWVQGPPALYRDFPGYTVKAVDEHVLRVRVRFGPDGRTAWRIRTADWTG
jgi:hypothetical protein